MEGCTAKRKMPSGNSPEWPHARGPNLVKPLMARTRTVTRNTSYVAYLLSTQHAPSKKTNSHTVAPEPKNKKPTHNTHHRAKPDRAADAVCLHHELANGLIMVFELQRTLN